MRLSTSLKLSAKLNLAIGLLITAVIVAYGWGFIRHEESTVTSLFKKRGEALTVNFAYNSEFGLLSRNKEELESLMRGLLKEDDVVAAAVLDEKGNLVATLVAETEEGPLFGEPVLKKLAKGIHSQTKTRDYQSVDKPYLYITSTVFTNSNTLNEDGFFYAEAGNSSVEVIGQAVICLTIRSILEHLSRDRQYLQLVLLIIIITI